MMMRSGNIRAVLLGSALTLATAGYAKADETSPPTLTMGCCIRWGEAADEPKSLKESANSGSRGRSLHQKNGLLQQPPTNAPASGVEKLTHQAKDAVTTTTTYLIRQKEQLQKSLSDKMAGLNKQLSDLKAKSEQAGDRAKSEWTNRLTRLQQKKQIAAKKLNQLKKSTADKWREIKAGTETALADLEKALKDAFAQSKDDDKSSKQ